MSDIIDWRAMFASQSVELTALKSEIARLTAEKDRLREALVDIANASPHPDKFEFFDVWNDYAPYLQMSEHGPQRAIFKSDDQQDIHAHGQAMGVHESALKARAALTAQEVPHD